jgi:hypothetical protein
MQGHNLHNQVIQFKDVNERRDPSQSKLKNYFIILSWQATKLQLK